MKSVIHRKSSIFVSFEPRKLFLPRLYCYNCHHYKIIDIKFEVVCVLLCYQERSNDYMGECNVYNAMAYKISRGWDFVGIFFFLSFSLSFSSRLFFR